MRTWRVKRVIAFSLYGLGALNSLAWLVHGLSVRPALGSLHWWDRVLLAVAMSLAFWWITAGIAVRLGVRPEVFGRAVVALVIGRDGTERAEPQEPSALRKQ